VYDPGDFLAAVRGDRVHDLLSAGMNSTTSSRGGAGSLRAVIAVLFDW
jgi:hypothetical protein